MPLSFVTHHFPSAYFRHLALAEDPVTGNIWIAEFDSASPDGLNALVQSVYTGVGVSRPVRLLRGAGLILLILTMLGLMAWQCRQGGLA